MSNLGGYQTMVILAKKAGGPKRLGGLLIAGGGVAALALKAGGTKARESWRRRGAPHPLRGQTFVVLRDGQAGGGPALSVGDRFTVVEGDGGAVLIRVIGRTDNPHVVSDAFLADISDYPDAAGQGYPAEPEDQSRRDPRRLDP